MKISIETHNNLKRMVASMEETRTPWLTYWQECADYVLPRRYTSIYKDPAKAAELRNPKILDGTGTLAANTLAAGMMNGITSPARPWFRLGSLGADSEVVRWLDDSTMRMLYVMGESNYYTGMATIYQDLSGFATSAMVIHEDDEDVFRCYNFALGEYAILQNNRKLVDRFSYTLRWRVEQIVGEWGLENCSPAVQTAWNNKGANRNAVFDVKCLIEPHSDSAFDLGPGFRFRRIVWEDKGPVGSVLAVDGFREWPCVIPRWQTIGNDSYGTGPVMDALGDIKQLQLETKRKAQGLDKLVSPPLVADLQLQNRPTALLPNGITYAPSGSQIGVKPIYQINLPLAELSNDIMVVQQRIREIFFNDLFKMISQLTTVRSATEIDARTEEKLILLGPVLEKFQGEALDASLRRIFFIMLRRGLFLPLPRALVGREININYISVLNDAQRAVGAAPIERYVGFLGNIAGAVPEALQVPDWTELILDYAERLGVPSKNNKTREQIAAAQAQVQQQEQVAGAAEVVPNLAQGAKTLSEIPVGGAANALSTLLGG